MTEILAISVVIPTRNRRVSLRRVLSALQQQTLARNQFEVVVSVDGSADGSVETAEEFASSFALQVVWQAHAGRAAACNAGARRSRGAILLFLDDDMEPSASLLEAHVAAHRRRPRIAVLGAVPVSLGSPSPPVVNYIGNKFENHLRKLERPQQSIGYRDFYSGNCSIHRAVLFEVGLFDEAFQVYGNEDGELAKRLLAAGVTLTFSAEALAYQHYEKDFDKLAADTIAKGTTAVLFAQKHPDAFDKLPLSRYYDAQRRWRWPRAILLGATRVFPPTRGLVMNFVSLAERYNVRWLPRCYALVLDYLYWVGVRQATSRPRCSSRSS